jgi:hypothetical protein
MATASPVGALWMHVVWALVSPLFSGEFLRILLDRHMQLFEYSETSSGLRAKGEELLLLACKKDVYTDYGVVCEIMRASRYQVRLHVPSSLSIPTACYHQRWLQLPTLSRRFSDVS